MDGSIDWLALPNLDSPSVFGALLDASRGGRFWLEPPLPYATTRRYDPDTNVLETTFTTDLGTVRVTDALLLDGSGLSPLRELVRVVDGVDGTVPMRWSVEPRFGYASARTSIAVRDGVPVASSGTDALAVVSFGLGRPNVADGRITGGSEVRAGSTGMLVLSAASQEPVVVPSRGEVLDRLRRTRDAWSGWAAERSHAGPFRDAVIRSGLALRLLVFSPSGAIAGAATTSLPEEIGGDPELGLSLLVGPRRGGLTRGADRLGLPDRSRSVLLVADERLPAVAPQPPGALSLGWRHPGAGANARPRGLSTLATRARRQRGDRPAAAGHIRGPAPLLVALRGGRWRAHGDLGGRLAQIADLVCRIWRSPDSGIWEVRSEPRQYTQSKMMCWVALDRAIALAASSRSRPVASTGGVRERDEIETFVEERCWSEALRSYVRSAGSEDLDASVLHASILGYGEPAGERMLGTLAAIDRHLRDGPLVMRYLGDDGLPGEEGAFLACSFWLADASGTGRAVEEAEQLMEPLLGDGQRRRALRGGGRSGQRSRSSATSRRRSRIWR